MDDLVYAPSMTNRELLAHIDRWRENMNGDLRALSRQNLLDPGVVAPTLQGVLDDVAHLFLIVREVVRRLPDDAVADDPTRTD